MTETELKPCPFCGGTKLKTGGDDKIVGVWCLTCQATGPNHYGSREWNDRSCLIDKPEAGEAEHDVVEEGAKILAKWLRYAWDGLQDRDISAEYPDWTHNSFGGYQLQGGKPALRKVASAILALSSPLSAGDTGEVERLESARAEQWRLRREAEASRDTAKAVAHSLRTERDDLRAALSEIIEGWDFWEVSPHDREPPRDAIRRSRAALTQEPTHE
ncbi:hypothetical protein ACLMJV_16885 [Sinorhizobium meliloti]|uniref:hypothetical protein n=1 Tax=Rhizobium meliloti TaxID=382 RepID=UPI00398C8453